MQWTLILLQETKADRETLNRLLTHVTSKTEGVLRIDDLRHDEPHLPPQVVIHADDPRTYQTLIRVATALGQATIR